MVNLFVYIVSAGRGGECSRVGEQCENGLCVRVNGVLTCRCNVGFTKVGSYCVGMILS